ncbi:MAG: hypothetical protein ACXV5Q_11540 [Frankiaceae bacterium]
MEQGEQLHRSDERYADLFHRGPDGFLVTNRLGVICEANRQAGALLERCDNLAAGSGRGICWPTPAAPMTSGSC